MKTLLYVVAIISALTSPWRLKAADSGEGHLSKAMAKAIFANLAQLDAGAKAYYLYSGKTTALLADLVGPDKGMKKIVVVDGEEYKNITFNKNTPIRLKVRTGEIIGVDMRDNEDCTYVFHQVRRNESIDSIAAINNVTIEQMRLLNPGVNLLIPKADMIVSLK